MPETHPALIHPAALGSIVKLDEVEYPSPDRTHRDLLACRPGIKEPRPGVLILPEW